MPLSGRPPLSKQAVSSRVAPVFQSLQLFTSHPNVIPRTMADIEAGQEAILEFGREVIARGGSPLSEHGVGRSAIKQALLRQLYGDRGIEEMRAVKRALDPEWKLAPGVIFP